MAENSLKAKQKQEQEQARVSASSSSADAQESMETETHKQRKQKEEEDEVFSHAMELACGSALPMAMHAAIELGVFDILANAGPGAKLSAAEIAAQMPSKNPDAPAMLDRICGLLVHHCVLGCSVHTFHRSYCLGPVSKHFVRNQDGVSLAPLMALIHDKVYLDSWSQVKDAVLEGGVPFNRVHGMHGYEYASRDPRFSQVFNTAMFNHTTLLVKKMLESYDGFENLKQIVDVGGGIGVALSLIISKYPKIKGINFDMPHVIQHAPPYPGVKHVAGDMFESVPKGDAIILKWILNDWGDDDCVKILKNCYSALPYGGKVLAMVQVLPIYPEITTYAKVKSLLDMHMMIQKPGGRERQQHELFGLIYAAGFKSIGFNCQVYNTFIMEFNKNGII
ncbi:caffeic acid 3-O-methyltransferase-like [Corylus avellana]|uniref:caffeic acid 3-O-methyltransferase-like n=1 Tax=Corylus avellana TaxID=13451 RepID=UPI001E20BF5F|nr:caffeic acid 3-O-methyltransferase-like [Corylus avellana]